MKYLTFSIVLLFWIGTVAVQAQVAELEIMAPYVIAGKWTGQLTQVSGGIAKQYYYEVDLTLNGTTIAGKGIIKTGSMYGYFRIKGELKGHQVLLKDVEITNEKIRERAAWCIKNMPLQFLYRAGAYRLEGPWSGYTTRGDCQPGRIYLQKAAIRA